MTIDKSQILHHELDSDLVERYDWTLKDNSLVTQFSDRPNKYTKQTTKRLTLAREIAKRIYKDLGRAVVVLKDGNPLNVQRSNISVPGKRKLPNAPFLKPLKDPSKFRGVYHYPRNTAKPYRAFFEPTKKSLGYYATPEEAARAVNKEIEAFYTGTEVDYSKFLNNLPLSPIDVYEAFDAQPFVNEILADVKIYPDLKTHAELLAVVQTGFEGDAERLLKFRQGKTPMGIRRGADAFSFDEGLKVVPQNQLQDAVNAYRRQKLTIKLDGYRLSHEKPIRADWGLSQRFTLTHALKIVNTLIPYALGKDFPLNDLNNLGDYFQAFLQADLEDFKNK